ncbi:MAG: sigma 54-interacting transcriptional regulator [Proteobacteria bacterium]|nr:sigma 54-interacting transcriptional regulator [Pseudomonadota bacterium]
MLDEKLLLQSLHQAILFKDISANEVEQIITAGQWRIVEQGRHVYLQGENHLHFYIVADGEVELSLSVKGGGQHSVSHVGPGGHFGETSLLTNSCDSLNARALTRTSLLCFDAEAFNSILLANKALQQRLSVALAKRLLVSFRDHAESLTKINRTRKDSTHNLDSTFFSEPKILETAEDLSPDSDREIRFAESTIARQINKAVQRFSNNLDPVLISGESGTGRRMIAAEIHRASAYKNGPYTEIDIRNIDPVQLEVELFGYDQDSPAFSQIAQLGVLKRLQGGTVALYNAEYIEPDCQRQLARLLKKTTSDKVASDIGMPMQSRVILICNDAPGQQDGHNRLLPSLYSLFTNQHFRAAPLREHRRDIPRLVKYYLKRYCLQYGKVITQVDDQAIGRFMNYDWPGNLTEMASVLQRAVLLGKSNEPLNHQIILGLPKSEGKWEFNLLRLPGVRAFFASRLFPILPKAIVGIFFVLVLISLFFGPVTAEDNIGLTLSWVIGWPLLIFSFFFLARTWCTICGLSVPGWLAQFVLKPERPTPQFIRRYSGWIMAFLCILLFWIETAWNVYQSPQLTAWIILTITLGSLFFSIFFKRRVWCRYLCPLGAINSLFSMPAILELRSNTHMCMNRCIDHLCYNGDDAADGCPMFRHPFLVDNNRDCILCGQCIKNCKLNSIHLNLRLAPQELWNQQSPRLEDSFLVVSLAAIFFPFSINQKDPDFLQNWALTIQSVGFPESFPLAVAILFFACIIFYLTGYTIMSQFIARITGNNLKTTASTLGYGMIPLVLGAFMAAHLEILTSGLWLLPDNLLDMVGLKVAYGPSRLMSRDTTFVLQFITVFGGLAAALYASNRIIKRLLTGRRYSFKMFLPSALLLCISAFTYLYFL